ncbi:AI-2E family transporter [Plantibacter sp. Mn2098]|uniref:AI-2E family transporter n=1 Tax=Plantibacter sp. Mn2098 TaxID=3395266 RepID=UPI003BBDEC57
MARRVVEETVDDLGVPRGMRIATAWSWRILVVVGASAVVIALVVVFEEIVVPLLVAMLVSALLAPTVATLGRHRWPHWLAILVTLVAFAIVVAGLVVIVVWQVRSGLPQLERESVAAYDRARGVLSAPPWNVSDAQLASWINDLGALAQKDSGVLIGGAVKVGGTLGHLLAGALIALFATIFMLIDGRGIWNWIVRIFPRAARPAMSAAGGSGWSTLTKFVRVQIVVALVNAIGIGAVAFFLGLPLAVPIGVVVLFASFIPVIGAIVSGAIAVVIALVYGGPVQAVVMLAGVLVVHLLEAHVLQPLLVGGAVKVHPLAVVVGVAAGTAIAGVPGALFAVPLIATVNAMVTTIASRSWRGSGQTRTASTTHPAPRPGSAGE